MSRFRDYFAVVEEIKGALQGAPLKLDLWEKDDGLRSCLLCAAGALGITELLPMIEFWGERKAETTAGKVARVVLQHFGKRSFDDIASQAGIAL